MPIADNHSAEREMRPEPLLSEARRDPTSPGARRRALVRALLGRPGSLRRWVLGTSLWLVACVVVSQYVQWLAKIAIFIFAVLLPIATFKARAMAVGDEDELRADLRRRRRLAAHAPSVDDARDGIDSADWLSPLGRSLDGAPPPPILEDVEVAQSGHNAEQEETAT